MLKARDSALLKFHIASLFFSDQRKKRKKEGQRKKENTWKSRKSILQMKPKKIVYFDDIPHKKWESSYFYIFKSVSQL